MVVYTPDNIWICLACCIYTFIHYIFKSDRDLPKCNANANANGHIHLSDCVNRNTSVI